MSTLERTQKLLAEILGNGIDPTPIVPHAYFGDDLGADSLDAIQIQIAVEEEFGIEIPDDEFGRIITVDDLVKRIDRTTPSWA